MLCSLVSLNLGVFKCIPVGLAIAEAGGIALGDLLDGDVCQPF
jgi:hypothetical protein